MKAKEAAVMSCAAGLVDHWRRFPDQPRTKAELHLWSVVDLLQQKQTIPFYRENRIAAEAAAVAGSHS